MAEFRLERPEDQSMSYDEAKAAALQRLRSHVAPYLERINELEQDRFADAGALPPLKAWRQGRAPHAIVIAKTKRRAMELARQNRHSFDSEWEECEGAWWYHLGYQEAVWIEELDDKSHGTGVFYEPLSREEAERIAEDRMSRYCTMNRNELFAQIGRTSTVTQVSAKGTPYKVTSKIMRSWDDPSQVAVQLKVDDCLGWMANSWPGICRKVSVAASPDWGKEGF